MANKYCVGQGAELGAGAHNPFCLDHCLNVGPSDGALFLHPNDVLDYRYYEEHARQTGNTVTRVDRIGDFRRIPFDDASLDYVVSSHVIEHEPNPIAGFKEVFRVLKEGGVSLMIFPKRNAEKRFDIFRPLTRLETLIQAYEENWTIDQVSAPSGRWRDHYHVYSLQSMMRLVNWMNQQELTRFCVEAVEETDSKVGNGHTVVLRKMSPHVLKNIDYTLLIEMCVREQSLDQGLLAAKMSLSFNFFQETILQTAALFSVYTQDPVEAKEFYRQCLILNPEDEARRREFHEIFGEYYVNPLP
jgi:hypothetical protein